MQAHAPDLIPRRALLAAGGVLVATLAGIAGLRVAGYSTREADAPATAQRELRFADRSDGGIDILDARTGARIDSAHGEQGFLRGTLRGLMRERKRMDRALDAPLVLTARADGRLTLADPSTGARIDLESFGPTNAGVFARWLGERP
jgi:putative photosynthetic complex assembly protein